jgi:dienelactone hydrolase
VLHGFFGLEEGPRPLFGNYHVPTRPVRSIGYVICPPLGWEGIQLYQSLQRLAAELARAGFPTLRLHYDGNGESLGSDDEPGRVAAWLESVRRAVDAMKKLPGVEGVGLVGVRIGATLAAMVASEKKIENLVLWEVCVRGEDFTREMEILASASQSALSRGPDYVSKFGVEGGGYLYTTETCASLGALDLLKTKLHGSPDVLFVCRTDRPPIFAKKLREAFEKDGCKATLEQIAGHKEAMTYPEKAVVATAILDRVKTFAVERSKTLSDAEPPILKLADEVTYGKVRHRPIRFGPSHRIFGVLTEPVKSNGSTGSSSSRRPVLFLTGGVVPRTGVNRMYPEISTRLAEMGHTCLRMDISGICESPPADGAAPNDPHAASLLPDVKSAMELLFAHTGQRTISLIGLCSGAYASFQTAMADDRVAGATLLNPEVFHLGEGGAKFSETQQNLDTKYYLQSLMSLAAWKKLLSGKANVRYIAGFVTAKVKTTVAKGRERLSARVKKAPAPPGVAGDFYRLLEKKVKLAIVVAKNDPGYEPLMRVLGTDLDMLKEMGLRLRIVPGPDHTFNDFATRRPLVDWLVDILSDTRPEPKGEVIHAEAS